MREGRSDGHHEEAVVPIQETEQKRNTLEQVRDAFSVAAKGLKEARRFGDAEVVERALTGLQRYQDRIGAIGKNVKRMEGRKPKAGDLVDEKFLPEDEFYSPTGQFSQRMRRMQPQRAPDYNQGFVAIRELGEQHPGTGHDWGDKRLIKRGRQTFRAMTPDGKAQLLRLLGVLGVDEQPEDLLIRSIREQQVDGAEATSQLPSHYYVTLDSPVLPQGVRVGIFGDTQAGPERSEWRLDVLLPEAAVNELLAEKQ